MAQLLLEVINSVEDGGILLQEVGKGLGEGFGLALSDLAQAAGVVLGEVPVDLADLAGGEATDAAGAGAVVTGIAAVHVGEDKVA